MIRILDSNALIALHKNKLKVRTEHSCYVPEEIAEEIRNDIGNAWFKSNPFLQKRIDDTDYLTAYARHLNRYGKVSFYNMKGFGDVAILAVLDILVREAPPTPSLSDEVFPENTIFLVTDDRGLRFFVKNVFGNAVVLQRSVDFLAML